MQPQLRVCAQPPGAEPPCQPCYLHLQPDSPAINTLRATWAYTTEEGGYLTGLLKVVAAEAMAKGDLLVGVPAAPADAAGEDCWAAGRRRVRELGAALVS